MRNLIVVRLTKKIPNQRLVQGLVYKKLVQLSVKEFIYSGQSEDSISNLNEVIDILESTSILVR